MSAVVFLLVRQYANRIRRLFSKPLNAILTILAVLFIMSGPVVMLINPNFYEGLVGEKGREVAIAGVQLFIGITLILSALSQQSGLFTYSEASILFSAPLTRRTILLYSTLQSLPGSILTSVFLCFYFPWLIGSVMTPLKLLATLLVMSLLCFCIFIIYYYIYIQDIAHEGLKKRLKKYAWIFFGVILAIYAVIWLTNGHDFGKAAITFFASPYYNAVPLFGWAKWAVAALLNGDYITGFIPATLLLAVSGFVLARMYYSQDVDFYEKAQLDSVRLQQMVDVIRSSGYDAGGVAIKKVRKARGSFREGAAAIMSRQLLEMKKRGPMLTFRDFINGLIYLVIGLAAGMDFIFVYTMIVFSMIVNTTTDSWNAEFKKPYIYLIPESPFRKLLYAVLPSIIKNVLAESVIVLAAAIIFKAGVQETVLSVILLAAYTLLFTSAGVFTYRIMGSMTNVVLLMVMRMLFIMAAAIPGGVLAIVMIAAARIEDTVLLMVPMIIVNLLVALLFIFLSRKLLLQSEIMN